MAREAVLRDNKILVSRRFAVPGSVDITKGTYLWLDPVNEQASGAVTAANMASLAFLGFAHADKDGDDTNDTSITADKGAIYDLTASGAITAGKLVKAVQHNYVAVAQAGDVASSFAIIIGRALETAADAEQINVEVFP